APFEIPKEQLPSRLPSRRYRQIEHICQANPLGQEAIIRTMLRLFGARWQRGLSCHIRTQIEMMNTTGGFIVKFVELTGNCYIDTCFFFDLSYNCLLGRFARLNPAAWYRKIMQPVPPAFHQ